MKWIRPTANQLATVCSIGVLLSSCTMQPTRDDLQIGTIANRCPAGSADQCAQAFGGGSRNARENSKLLDSFRDLSLKDSRTGIAWPSRILRNFTPRSTARLREIIDRLLDPTDPLNAEIEAYQRDLAGKGSSAFWDRYFKMYDGILGFSDGYLSIFQQASRFLPARGHIVDYGFGTANGSASLAYLEPGRQMSGIDFSSAGLARAQEKMHEVSRETGAPSASFTIGDLTKLAPYPDSADGALMNNVLYAIPEAERAKLLNNILVNLKPGARLVINDPSRNLQTDPAAARSLIENVVTSALRNGSPMTEFDFAFFGYLNVKFLFGGGRFLTPHELAQLGRAAGFNVVTEQASYYGGATLIVFEKPQRD